MPPATRPMLLSLTISVLLIVSVLCTILVALSTEFFTSRVPGGPDAMATATPMLAAMLAWILILLSVWGVAARGAFNWIALTAPLMYLLVTIACAGLAAAAAGAFGAWLERVTAAQPWAAIPGVVLPLVLQVFLLVLAWMDPVTAGQHHAVRLMSLLLTIGAAGGWVLAIWAAVHFGGGSAPGAGSSGDA